MTGRYVRGEELERINREYLSLVAERDRLDRRLTEVSEALLSIARPLSPEPLKLYDQNTALDYSRAALVAADAPPPSSTRQVPVKETRPPCPTCGGEGHVLAEGGDDDFMTECPDCQGA